MSLLNDDANESALFCKTLIQKRKASSNINPKKPKQLKLNFSLKTPKDKESAGEENGNCNEKIGPISDYFQPKNTSNICPLCTKSFKTDSAYSNHMKQCAKSHKMTTQQLLSALELQKQQMQQRSLHSQLAPATKKIPSKKKEEKERDSYDLALGLALSKSLGSQESKPESTPETQKTTLQQFGIKSSHTAEPLGRKKNESRKKSSLRTRSAEDRQKILIEKLGVILLDEEEGLELGSQKHTSNPSFLNDQLADFVNSDQRLWNLGENDGKPNWYVEGIKSHMMVSHEGSEKDDKKCILSSNIEIEISKLQLPREGVHNSWKKMINNSEFSDVTARTKDCRSFHLHSVVLFARFPEILKQDYESAFEKHNLSTLLIFLEYLYCGTLNSLVKEEMQNLHNLAFEIKYTELIEILNSLEKNLSEKTELDDYEMEEKDSEHTMGENKSPELFERDMFAEEKVVVDLTQSSNDSIPKESGNTSETESFIDKPFMSFLQREKEREELEIAKEVRKSVESTSEVMQNGIEEEDVDLNQDHSPGRGQDHSLGRGQDQLRIESDDSATKDLTEEFQIKNARRSNDSIILSSGSESRESMAKECLKMSPHNSSRTFSPVDNYEVPHFDPYDDFHCFSEEQFSPPGVPSQSLITGDVSPGEPLRSPPNAVAESPEEPLRSPLGALAETPEEPSRSPLRALAETPEEPSRSPLGALAETPEESLGMLREVPMKNSEYCSTPVTVRPSFRMKSSTKCKLERGRKRSDLSASRILRKSLGLEFKMKNKRSSAFQRKSARKKEDAQAKDFIELLTDSILNELSKSATLKSSTPVTMRNFVEVTPVLDEEEFRESVTPLPNYSTMEENLLKEQLAKYGLKKNLAKSKAKKILRHIYEELHPLYNAETGKFVKTLRSGTPEGKKKTKSRGKASKNVKAKQNANSKSKGSKKKELNSSKESDLSDGSDETLEGQTDHDTTGSDFENLSETLTQSAPSNPVDLPSAFVEFLDRNPAYHRKVLSYEPIWLEDLQKKLKENFKKHFKMSDLMDYLDQKCITFRSETQVKKKKKQLENKKNGGKKIPS